MRRKTRGPESLGLEVLKTKGSIDKTVELSTSEIRKQKKEKRRNKWEEFNQTKLGMGYYQRRLEVRRLLAVLLEGVWPQTERKSHPKQISDVMFLGNNGLLNFINNSCFKCLLFKVIFYV